MSRDKSECIAEVSRKLGRDDQEINVVYSPSIALVSTYVLHNPCKHLQNVHITLENLLPISLLVHVSAHALLSLSFEYVIHCS